MSFPLSYAAFIEAFEDFAETNPAFVQKKLDAAARQIDETVWGDQAEDGHGNLTAHLITMSPLGRDKRVQSEDGLTSAYGDEFDRLARIVGGSYRPVLC